MTIEELTPEAATLLRSLVNNPKAIGDSAMLQLAIADGLVMGNPARVHITASGKRLLFAYEAAQPI